MVRWTKRGKSAPRMSAIRSFRGPSRYISAKHKPIQEKKTPNIGIVAHARKSHPETKLSYVKQNARTKKQSHPSKAFI